MTKIRCVCGVVVVIGLVRVCVKCGGGEWSVWFGGRGKEAGRMCVGGGACVCLCLRV